MLSSILILMPSAQQRGGAELSLLHLLRAGAGWGVHWRVVFLERGPMVRMVREAGVEAVVVDAGRFRNPLRVLATVRAIARMIRDVRADAVLGWMTKAHLYGGPAAWLAGVPAIWFQKGLPSPRSSMERIAAMIPAAGILTCSSYVAGAQQALTPTTPIRPIHSAVELDHFDPDQLPSPASLRRRLKLPESGPLVGIFGRLQHWKGMHVAIDAMPAVLRQHPDASLLIAGGAWPLEPGYAVRLRQQVDRLQLGDRVIFAGQISTEVIPDWMQACDVIVHASDREPFGIVLLEAMCLGKPVVAGSEGGPVEIITEGLNGLFARFGDSEALSRAVLRLLDDKTLARQLGAQARVRAMQFSAERFAENVTREVLLLIGKCLPETAEAERLAVEPVAFHQ